MTIKQVIAVPRTTAQVMGANKQEVTIANPVEVDRFYLNVAREINALKDTPNTYYIDATQADQGVATTVGDKTIKDFVDTIGASTKGTIVLRHTGTGNTTTYTLTTSETIPSNITLIFESGAIMGGIGTLTAYSPNNIIASPMQQIRNSSGLLRFTVGGIVHPGWWGATGDGTTDDYATVQAALACYFATTGQRGEFRFHPGLNYYTETGWAYTFSANSVYPVIINGEGSHVTSGLSSGRVFTFTSAATVRSIIFYPPMITGNQAEDGCILLDGGTLASGHYFYNVKVINAICEQFTGTGIEFTNHIFESQVVRPYISAHSSNITGYGIFFNDTAAGDIGIIDIVEPNTRGGLHGIYANQGSAAVNIRGGECITAQEEGCKIIGATGGIISGLHVENNWESAANIAAGGAGLSVTGDTNIIGVVGTTVRNQRYSVSVTPTSGMGTNVIGVAGLGDTVVDVYCGNAANSHLNLFGNMTIDQSGRNTKLSRVLSHHITDAVSTSGTGEDDLISFTIPAYTLGQTGAIKFHTFGSVTNVNNGNKTIKYKIGSNSYTVQTAANVSGDWELEIIILGHNDSAQRATHKFWLNGALVAHGMEAPAQAQTSDIIFKTTGECADAGDTVTCSALRVQYL